MIAIFVQLLGMFHQSHAAKINAAHIYMVGDCGSLLTYQGRPVKVSYVEYTENGVHYPAYCMDKTKPGAETGEYTVTVDEAIKDVALWRRVICGYPYQSIEELGVANKEEAFTATKQAIYCYIHGNNPNDYGAIGEAGNRTLNAMKKIIQEAENPNETQISSTITIEKNQDEWKQDELDPNYLSKVYQVTAGAEIQNYSITVKKEGGIDVGGIRLTNEKNEDKTEFQSDEKFKILIPIKNLTEKGNITLTVDAQIKTKPVLYGKAPNSNYQDYALTAAIYEDGTGQIKDEYPKNETKIIVIKKDQETGELLKGVEFELLNEKQEVVYQNLKTDEEGKIIIENLVPGTYYLRETKSIDGYEIYEELIRIDTALNQEITVTVNNQKEEPPKVETKEPKQKEVKKLPVTGC